MRDDIKRLSNSAKALIDSISFDDHGTMIGGEWRGGNGGLISKKTIEACDELRRAINALKEVE